MTQEIIKQTQGSVELLRWFHVPNDAPFEAKKEALQLANSKVGGTSEMGRNYIGRTLWVTEVYMGRVRLNATKNGGSPIRTVDSTTGEVVESNYEERMKTVLHVVAIENHLLSAPLKVRFVGRSVQWYFEDQVIPLFGLQFEHPLAFIFTVDQSGAYSIECLKSAVFPGGENA